MGLALTACALLFCCRRPELKFHKRNLRLISCIGRQGQLEAKCFVFVLQSTLGNGHALNQSGKAAMATSSKSFSPLVPIVPEVDVLLSHYGLGIWRCRWHWGGGGNHYAYGNRLCAERGVHAIGGGSLKGRGVWLRSWNPQRCSAMGMVWCGTEIRTGHQKPVAGADDIPLPAVLVGEAVGVTMVVGEHHSASYLLIGSVKRPRIWLEPGNRHLPFDNTTFGVLVWAPVLTFKGRINCRAWRTSFASKLFIQRGGVFTPAVTPATKKCKQNETFHGRLILVYV